MKRIQRKREKGWRMPPNTVSITRPGEWGNGYKVGELDEGGNVITRESALFLYENWLQSALTIDPNWLDPLRGKDLACFCKEGEACHGDILIAYANADRK